MLGSIFQYIFGCAHRRLTRPITPVRKPGVPSGETSVVCLDCGREFAYDWNHMRVGKQIERSQDSGVLRPEMPSPAKAKMKYALIGSCIPLVVFLGRALVSKRPDKATSKVISGADYSRDSGDLGRRIEMTHGGPSAGFRVGQLIDHIRRSGRGYIILGDVDCALADHPKPRSLDYWLRENFARNKEIRQATREVISQLVNSGMFELSDDLRCPDTGARCSGLKLKADVAPESPDAARARA